jgi:predicted glycoside hydrolase/deacetylase ChbG (UPF0249 family)
MSPAINKGILDIARLDGIRRVSVMPLEPYFSRNLEELRALPHLSFGLHFNLTHGSEINGPAKLLTRWLFASPKRKRLLIQWVRFELRSQIDAAHAAGIHLSYFDSHQHIHLVPGLFESIADILHGVNLMEVRTPLDFALVPTKKFPIPLLSIRLKNKLRKYGFNTNPFYYPKQTDFLNSNKLRQLLELNSEKEILVHPAAHDDLTELRIPDDYRGQRVLEYQTLKLVFESEERLASRDTSSSASTLGAISTEAS